MLPTTATAAQGKVGKAHHASTSSVRGSSPRPVVGGRGGTAAGGARGAGNPPHSSSFISVAVSGVAGLGSEALMGASFVEKEALLGEAAAAEAQRALDRIRRHREETGRLTDADEATAAFAQRQVKRLARTVARMHDARNTLQDLATDLQRRQAMRPTEFAKKREAVFAGPLPEHRAVSPAAVWRTINASLKGEQHRLLAAETHQHTMDVAGPILAFLKQQYRHPIAVAICERAQRAVADGSVDERSRGVVPYANPPGSKRANGGKGPSDSGDGISEQNPFATSKEQKKGKLRGGGGIGDIPTLATTDPQGHQTAKAAATLVLTRSFPKSSPQRLYADELFAIPQPTDLLCDDVVSVLVHTAVLFKVSRAEVALMLQDKARSLVMNHVRPLKRAIDVKD